MKKLISVFLAVILMLSSISTLFISFANDDSIKFAVATDIHAKEKGYELPINYPESELYFHAANSGNLYNEAVGILTDFLYQSYESGAQFILIPGDISNNGNKDQHEYLAQVFEKFESECKIPVYVTPGNHDYYNSKPDDFKTYYKNFGFDEAISVDSETASYSADLPGNYRLVAIDSNDPGNNGDALNDRLFNWIDEQVNNAKKDGKTVIAMMHHPLLDPIPYAQVLMSDFIVKNHKKVAERFTDWGINYVFTGHEHGNNITSFTGSNGNIVYDILTTALTSYPLEYRCCTLSGDKLEIKNKSITACNFDFVVDGYNEKQLELMRTDYTEYALGYFKYSIEKKISKYTSAAFILKKLKITDGPIADVLNIVMPVVDEALTMPLYDIGDGSISVESLCKKNNVDLPESNYKNLYDLATSMVAMIYYGNENMSFDSSAEGKVLIIGLNTMLKYLFATVGNKTATAAINCIISGLGIDKEIELDLFSWTESIAIGANTSYKIAFKVLTPLLEKFTVDDAVCDRDAELSIVQNVKSQNIFQKLFAEIVELWNKLLEIIGIR